MHRSRHRGVVDTVADPDFGFGGGGHGHDHGCKIREFWRLLIFYGIFNSEISASLKNNT